MPLRRSLVVLLAGLGCLAPWARAVYAPVTDVEKGRFLTTYAQVGSYYDTNIFGAPRAEQDSWVFYVAPRANLNWNPRKQMLVAAGAGLRWDSYSDRPENRDTLSYNSTLRLAYTFNPRLEAEVSGSYDYSRNPESLLPGANVLLADDQSREDISIDSRLRWTINPRSGLIARLRASQFHYREAALGLPLDRREYVSSVAWTYLLRPRSRSVMEHRAQLVRYRFDPTGKDKDSQLFLAGLDYSVGRTLGLTSRVGGEWRRRAEGDRSRPYGEVGAKWDYTKLSYVSGGYAYVVEEVANVTRYNDISVHRFTLAWQHGFTAKTFAGLSVGVEPSRLNTRQGLGPRLHETTVKLGGSLEYKLRPRWTVLATCDYDDIASDDPDRDLHRVRTGVSSRWVF